MDTNSEIDFEESCFLLKIVLLFCMWHTFGLGDIAFGFKKRVFDWQITLPMGGYPESKIPWCRLGLGC
jgi:hypothetical protein